MIHIGTGCLSGRRV